MSRTATSRVVRDNSLSMIQIVSATIQLAEAVLANAREPELSTIAKFNINAKELLRETIEKGSPAFVALVDGIPACAWGLDNETVIGGFQKMWMITTPLVEENTIAFLRLSREFVRFARENYGPIDGAVDPDNTISERWLRWIGFREIEDGPIKKMRYA